METQILIGDRVAMVGADGKPDRIGEVTGIMHRESGVTYEVRAIGTKRARPVNSSELRRIGAPLDAA